MFFVFPPPPPPDAHWLVHHVMPWSCSLLYFQQTQATCYDQILNKLRPEHEYFRVGFYGQSFPLFLRVSTQYYHNPNKQHWNNQENVQSFQNTTSGDTIWDRTLFGTVLKCHFLLWYFDTFITYDIIITYKDILNAGGVWNV